jgi:hypothetical protein
MGQGKRRLRRNLDGAPIQVTTRRPPNSPAASQVAIFRHSERSPSIADTATASLIVSPLAGFAGIGLGAWLSHKLSRVAVQDEREWSSRQQVQTRKEEAAERLDAVVLKALADCPQGSMDAKDVADELQPVATQLIGAWAQNSILDDPEIERRFLALNTTVGMASRARNWRRPGSEPQMINLWPIQIAMRELREALVYYLKRESPPPAKYPTSKELVRIVLKNGGRDFQALDDWLVDNEVA